MTVVITDELRATWAEKVTQKPFEIIERNRGSNGNGMLRYYVVTCSYPRQDIGPFASKARATEVAKTVVNALNHGKEITARVADYELDYCARVEKFDYEQQLMLDRALAMIKAHAADANWQDGDSVIVNTREKGYDTTEWVCLGYDGAAFSYLFHETSGYEAKELARHRCEGSIYAVTRKQGAVTIRKRNKVERHYKLAYRIKKYAMDMWSRDYTLSMTFDTETEALAWIDRARATHEAEQDKLSKEHRKQVALAKKQGDVNHGHFHYQSGGRYVAYAVKIPVKKGEVVA